MELGGVVSLSTEMPGKRGSTCGGQKQNAVMLTYETYPGIPVKL